MPIVAHTTIGMDTGLHQPQRRWSPPAQGFLKPGRNYWRKENASRLGYVIDAAAFFSSFVDAASKAEKQIWIVGWDTDSRVELTRPDGEQPAVTLNEFLFQLCEKKPDLKVYILSWDFTFIYSLEREALPQFKFDWLGHPRVRFVLDGSHPALGSHHQKVVVIDDKLAFSGGLDITARRWDTPEHVADDPRRVDPWGKTYGPFHDVQVALEGDIAAALGDLVRDRWRVATGEMISPPSDLSSVEAWPPSLKVDLTNVDVAISRTIPAMKGTQPAFEVERLFIDAIARAQKFIFFEAQYFSSKTIAKCLARRLREHEGPEVILILPRDATGWIEESTMSVLRGRGLEMLRQADCNQRFKVYHPVVPGLTRGYVKVHSKVMIVDDEFCRIGSANLNQRSMGLDSECDIAFEARGERRVKRAIGELRSRLLAEHLDSTPEEVEARFQSHGSLASAVESLRGKPRTLVELQRRIPEWLDILVPHREVIDPSGPYRLKRGLRRYFPNVVAVVSKRVPFLGRFKVIPFVVLVICLLAAWKFTPLREWVEPETMSLGLQKIKTHPLGPLGVLAAFVVGGMVMIPQTAMVVATALTFDAHSAFWLSLGGTMASSAISYWLGGRFTADHLERLSNRWLKKIKTKLAAGGWMAVMVVRLIPVAPFTVVNLVAGSVGIRFNDFLIGTVAGTVPGIVVITLLAEQIGGAIRSPDFRNVFLLAVLCLAIFAAMKALKHFLSHRTL